MSSGGWGEVLQRIQGVTLTLLTLRLSLWRWLMEGMVHKSAGLALLGLVLTVAVGVSGCRGRANVDASSSNGEVATDLAQAEAEAEDPAAISGYQSTPINPPRMAQLSASQEGAQINVRSQPTTQSESLGQGIDGDRVQLLRLAEGEGGYSWYYLKFDKSGQNGWVRGDFINASREAVAQPVSDKPTETSQGACGRERQEAYFETASFSIYICNLGDSLRYVSLNKENQESLVTEDVRKSQNTYVAINSNYQYYINEASLAVYQVNDGAYSQLVAEKVIRSEQFLY